VSGYHAAKLPALELKIKSRPNSTQFQQPRIRLGSKLRCDNRA